MKKNVFKKIIGLFILVVTIMLPSLVNADTSIGTNCGSADEEGNITCTVTYNIIDESGIDNLTVTLTEQGSVQITSIENADGSDWTISNTPTEDNGVWTINLVSPGIMGEGNLFTFSYQTSGETDDKITISLNSNDVEIDSPVENPSTDDGENLEKETIYLDTVSSTGQTVTVGEVDMPVYSVDIEWGDLTYNYSYNEVTETYEWKKNMECYLLEDYQKKDYENGNLDLYDDSECKKSVDNILEFDDAINNVYYGIEGNAFEGNIFISDNSTNGKIIPSIHWKSTENYDFVIGKFQYEGYVPVCAELNESNFNENLERGEYIYSDNKCTNIVDSENITYADGYYEMVYGARLIDMDYGEIPEYFSQATAYGPWHYRVVLSLENDPTKEATMPVAGDTIGTVTITLTAN